MGTVREIWGHAEQVEKWVETEHGYRLTVNIAIDELRRVPGRTPDEVVAAVAQRCLMVTWLLEGKTSVSGAEDPKALQWACHLGMISENEYHAVTGKHPDEYISPSGFKPWEPLQERPGVLDAFGGEG